jgi:hypothetical protein
MKRGLKKIQTQNEELNRVQQAVDEALRTPDDSAELWRDLIGDVTPKQVGVGFATLGAFQNASAFYYAANDVCQMLFHMPHDYRLGTDVHLHLHWAHEGTAIEGKLVVTFGVTYARGHNQENFPAGVTPVLTVATPDVATVPRYRHRIDELQLSASSPSATQINTSQLEPDGLIIAKLTATTIPVITGGSQNKPALLTCDLHYQSTNLGTLNKAPNFYR